MAFLAWKRREFAPSTPKERWISTVTLGGGLIAILLVGGLLGLAASTTDPAAPADAGPDDAPEIGAVSKAVPFILLTIGIVLLGVSLANSHPIARGTLAVAGATAIATMALFSAEPVWWMVVPGALVLVGMNFVPFDSATRVATWFVWLFFGLAVSDATPSEAMMGFAAFAFVLVPLWCWWKAEDDSRLKVVIPGIFMLMGILVLIASINIIRVAYSLEGPRAADLILMAVALLYSGGFLGLWIFEGRRTDDMEPAPGMLAA